MTNISYSIAQDYTRTPGPRYISQGDFSGEHFRQTVLLDLFAEAVDKNEILVINLDNTAGYGPSFLEESFGGLARLKDKALVRKHLNFISEEEPYLIEEIAGYINNAVSEAA